MQIMIRRNEGCQPQPFLLWDTIWDIANGVGDWAVAGADEPLNRGGLRAKAALATAVYLALFTDRACPPDHPLAKFADGDPRGWWGDGVDVRADLGEAPLGSLLWLLERSVVNAQTQMWAQSLAQDALSVMVGQGSVARVTVAATVLAARNGVMLIIGLYARDGTELFNQQFQIVWNQIGAAAR